jgi:hypothetical protein
MGMHRSHILGYVVRRLREMRLGGASTGEMLAYLRERSGDDLMLPSRYLRAAFLQRTNVFFYILPPGPVDTLTEETAAPYVDEHRQDWEHQLFPELRRVRDYLSFLEFAKEEHLIVTVCGWRSGDEGYRLHGVYDADSLEPVWSAKRGEKLRAAINRRLGDELVRFGPHDDWEHRNDRAIAGDLWGPQAPVIEFDPEGRIENRLNLEALASSEPYRRRWERLYPHHPVTP